MDDRPREGLPLRTARGNAFDRDDVADPQCAARPPVALEVDRVAELHRPVRHDAAGVADVDEEVRARVDPLDARHRALEAHLSFIVIGGGLLGRD